MHASGAKRGRDESDSYIEVRLVATITLTAFLLAFVFPLIFAQDWVGDNLSDTWKQQYGLSTNVYDPAHLVGWWQFNGSNSDIPVDRSGNGLNGTLNGFPTTAYGAGLFDNALYFTTNSSVSFPTPNSILDTITNQFTFSAWFQMTNAVTNPSTIATWSDAQTNSWTVGTDINGVASIAFSDAFGNIQTVSPSANAIPLYDGNWHQVAATYDSNQLATVYVDGRNQASGMIANWTPGTTAAFIFGVPDGISTNQPYVLDETRLYNRAMGPQEIVLLPASYFDMNSDGLNSWESCFYDLDPNGGPLDSNGIPYTWEIQYEIAIGASPDTMQLNGLTILELYENGLTPYSSPIDTNGLSYAWELAYFGQFGVDPTTQDAHGITNLQYSQAGVNPNNGGAIDDNNLAEWWQVKYFGHLGVDTTGTDQYNLTNLQYYEAGANPNNGAVIDGNGLPEWWQIAYIGYLGIDSSEMSLTGLTYLQDYQYGVNPQEYDGLDWQGDFSISFVWEVRNFGQAHINFYAIDQDGLTSLYSYVYGINPNGTQYDSNSLTYAWEIQDLGGLVHADTVDSTTGLTYGQDYTLGVVPNSSSIDINGIAYSWEFNYYHQIHVDPDTFDNTTGLTYYQEYHSGIPPGSGLLDGSGLPFAWESDYSSTCSITAPTADATPPMGSPVLFQVSGDASVTRVDYYVQGTLVDESTTPGTWDFSWYPTSSGDFTIEAIAYSASGPQLTVPVTIHVPQDSDNNGLPDWWEVQYFGHLGNDPGSSPDGSGQTLSYDYQNNINPTNYYALSGGSALTPTLSFITDTNDQTGASGQFLSDPLQVQVVDGSGSALVNAPVTFSVSPGSGLLATSTTGSLLQQQTAITDSSGIARICYQSPLAASVTGTITATAPGTSATPVQFTTSTLVDTSAPLAPIDLSTTLGDSTGEIDLIWTNTADNANVIQVSASTDGGTTWSTLGVVSPTSQSFAATGLDPTQSYTFSVAPTNTTLDLSSSTTTSSAASPPSAPTPPAPRYAVIDLKTLPDNASVGASLLNNSGTVALSLSDGTAYRWKNGKLTQLRTPDGRTVGALGGIAENDAIAGAVDGLPNPDFDLGSTTIMSVPFSDDGGPLYWSPGSAMGACMNSPPETYQLYNNDGSTSTFSSPYSTVSALDNKTIYGASLWLVEDYDLDTYRLMPTYMYRFAGDGSQWPSVTGLPQELGDVSTFLVNAVPNPNPGPWPGAYLVWADRDGHTLGTLYQIYEGAYDLSSVPLYYTVDGNPVTGNPVSINSKGEALINGNGYSLFNAGGYTPVATASSLRDLNAHTTVVTNPDGSTTTVSTPQLLGYVNSASTNWLNVPTLTEYNPTTKLWKDTPLQSLLPAGSPWTITAVNQINDGGAITATATETVVDNEGNPVLDGSGNPQTSNHAALLLPVAITPRVIPTSGVARAKLVFGSGVQVPVIPQSNTAFAITIGGQNCTDIHQDENNPNIFYFMPPPSPTAAAGQFDLVISGISVPGMPGLSSDPPSSMTLTKLVQYTADGVKGMQGFSSSNVVSIDEDKSTIDWQVQQGGLTSAEAPNVFSEMRADLASTQGPLFDQFFASQSPDAGALATLQQQAQTELNKFDTAYPPPNSGSNASTGVSIVASIPGAYETGPASGLFMVSVPTAPTSALTVNYTIGGTAVNGTDYATLSGSVVIAAGQTSAQIAVAPIQHALGGDKTVILTLSSSTNYTINSNYSADTVTIYDYGDGLTSNTSLKKNTHLVSLDGASHSGVDQLFMSQFFVGSGRHMSVNPSALFALMIGQTSPPPLPQLGSSTFFADVKSRLATTGAGIFYVHNISVATGVVPIHCYVLNADDYHLSTYQASAVGNVINQAVADNSNASVIVNGAQFSYHCGDPSLKTWVRSWFWTAAPAEPFQTIGVVIHNGSVLSTSTNSSKGSWATAIARYWFGESTASNNGVAASYFFGQGTPNASTTPEAMGGLSSFVWQKVAQSPTGPPGGIHTSLDLGAYTSFGHGSLTGFNIIGVNYASGMVFVLNKSNGVPGNLMDFQASLIASGVDYAEITDGSASVGCWSSTEGYALPLGARQIPPVDQVNTVTSYLIFSHN